MNAKLTCSAKYLVCFQIGVPARKAKSCQLYRGCLLSVIHLPTKSTMIYYDKYLSIPKFTARLKLNDNYNNNVFVMGQCWT